MAEASDTYSTPWDAPLVSAFPVQYIGVSILTACYRTTPEAIETLLPSPLKSTGDIVLIHIYDMPDVQSMGHVREANVMFGAAIGSVNGGFTSHLFIDSDAGLALGREVHGQPKKLAAPRLENRGDLIVGVVERNGIDVITATLPYKHRQGAIEDLGAHFDFATNINLKVIPNIDGSSAVRELTARRLENVVVHECWTGPCTVSLLPNAQAPVWRLPVVEPLDGFYWKADFRLVPGTTLHNYLAD